MKKLPAFRHYDLADGISLAAKMRLEPDHCGIYILRFADGQAYVGQAHRVTSRVSTHLRHYPDIVAVDFAPIPSEELDQAERHVIAEQSKTHQLRNIALMHLPAGKTKLDLVIEPAVQQQWLDGSVDDLVLGPRPEPTATPSAAAANLDKLRRIEYFDHIIELLTDYIGACLPYPHKTEQAFWSVTAMPSTGRRKDWHRLAVVNICNIEALVIGEDPQTRLSECFLNLNPDIELPWWAYATMGEAHYRSTGDTPVLHLGGDLWRIAGFLDQPQIRAAARAFALGQLRRGGGMQGRYHNRPLADEIYLRLEERL